LKLPLSAKQFSVMCYSVDVFGRRVLVGLTYSETIEFEALDATPPIDENGEILRWEVDEESFPPGEARWLELYRKHRAAVEDGASGS
jgi:hypothetical protein